MSFGSEGHKDVQANVNSGQPNATITVGGVPLPILQQLPQGSNPVRYPMYLQGSPLINFYPQLVPQSAAVAAMLQLRNFPGTPLTEAPVSHEVTGNDSVAQQSVVDGSPKFPQLISPAMMRTVPMLPRQPQIQIKSSPDIAFSNSAVENDVIHENRTSTIDLTGKRESLSNEIVSESKKPRTMTMTAKTAMPPPVMQISDGSVAAESSLTVIPPTSTVGVAGSSLQLVHHQPQYSLPLSSSLFPSDTRLFIMPCVGGGLQNTELFNCSPYLSVSDMFQTVFKPCVVAGMGHQQCYAWNYMEKVTPLSLEACFHLTAMYLVRLTAGEHLNPEKLQALLFAAQLGEKKWLNSSGLRKSNTSLTNHLTNMALYSAEGKVAIKETEGHLIDGIRNAIRCYLTGRGAQARHSFQPKYILVICLKDARMTSFCIISCDRLQNAYLTIRLHPSSKGLPSSHTHRLPKNVQHLMSSPLKKAVTMTTDGSVLKGFSIDDIAMPTTISYRPSKSHHLEVSNVVRCLYRAITTNVLNVKGPFRMIDFAVVGPDPAVLSEAKRDLESHSLLHLLKLMKGGTSGSTELSNRTICITDSKDAKKLELLLSQAKMMSHCLFFIIVLQPEQCCKSLLPVEEDVLSAHSEILEELKAAENVLFLHISQAPYSLQTKHSLLPPTNEFEWKKCQISVFGQQYGVDDVMDDHSKVPGSDLDPSHPVDDTPSFQLDSQFESRYSDLLLEKLFQSPLLLRYQMLIDDYTKALLICSGRGHHSSPSPNTYLIVQNLVSLPMSNLFRKGCMLLIRTLDYAMGSLVYKELSHVQEACGLEQRFALISDDGISSLSLNDHFLQLLRRWKFGQNGVHSEWKPSCYEDLEGLPCMVILMGKCRGGLRFPRSLRYVDCRLCFGHGISRTAFELDMQLFPRDSVSFIPKEYLTEEDSFNSSVAGSTKPKGDKEATGEVIASRGTPILTNTKDSKNVQFTMQDASDQPTDDDRSAGSSVGDDRIERDFDDLNEEEKHSSNLSSGRCSQVQEEPSLQGQVEWHVTGVPTSNLLRKTAPLIVGVSKEKFTDNTTKSGSGLVSTHQSLSVMRSPLSSDASLTGQGHPAVTLVTQTAEDSDGPDPASGVLAQTTHPWSASLQASFVIQQALIKEKEQPKLSPPMEWECESAESDDEGIAHLGDEPVPGEEYLQVPAMILMSSTYHHIQKESQGALFQEKLFLDPAYNTELVRTSKRQPLITDDFHIASSFYRKWNIPLCRSCGFCQLLYASRDQKRKGAEPTIEGEDPPHQGSDKHFLLCAPPEVDRLSVLSQLLYATYKELSSLDKVTVGNQPVLAPVANKGEDTFYPKISDWFKANAYSSILDLSTPVENEGSISGPPQLEWEEYLRTAPRKVEVDLSTLSAFDAKHKCQRCRSYQRGTSSDYQSVMELTYSIMTMNRVSAQLQLFVPKTQLHHFEIDKTALWNSSSYVMSYLKLSVTSKEGGDRKVLTPIFTPTTGRHDVGLMNIYHTIEGANHLHILVINQSEATSYRHLWPDHILMVLPDEERFKGYGAICYWIKAFAGQNYEANCKHLSSVKSEEKKEHIWPFILIMSDSCLMWKKLRLQTPDPSNRILTEDDTEEVSLYEVLSKLESDPLSKTAGAVGLLPWAEQYPPNLGLISNTHIDHSFVLLNLATTKKVMYNKFLYNSADFDFNFRLVTNQVPILRYNQFTVVKKPHLVGGKLSAFQTSTDTENFVVSLHHDSPSFLYYPGPLLMEEHLAHQGKKLFPLATNSDNPLLVIDNFVNLGPELNVVYVNLTQCSAAGKPSTVSPILKEMHLGGVLLYLCEGNVMMMGRFLQEFQFADGAALCLVTRDCKSMVKEVARLDLDERWKYQARNEHQTSCPDGFRPLFYLIRIYNPQTH